MPWPLALTLLAAFYLALRLPALGALPLFNDEAVYFVRAHYFPAMLFDWGLAGATFPDGKLLHEIALAALARLPADQLLTGRLLSTLCGLGTTLALAQMGRIAPMAHSAWAGLLAGALYTLAPLAGIHDVLAVPDSMLTLLSALVLWASLRLALEPRAGAVSGLAVGGLVVLAALVKLPGFLLTATPLLALLTLPRGWQERRRRMPALLLTVAVTAAGYLVLRELGYGLAERDKLAGAGLNLGRIDANLGLVHGWVQRYLPAVLLALPMALLAWGRAALRPYVVFLIMAGLCYVGGFVVIGQTLYSRYLLPAWPALLLAASVATVELRALHRWRRRMMAVLLGAALVWSALFQGILIGAPQQALMAAGDRFQYLEGWPAGQGFDQLSEDLRAAAQAQPGLIVVSSVEIRVGNLAARLALRGIPDVRLELADLGGEAGPAQVAALIDEGPLVVVVDAETAAAYKLRERYPNLHEAQRYGGRAGGNGFVIFAAGSPAPFFAQE